MISVSDFAARVKAKYPAYANIPDAELTQRIIAKHPEYQNQVALDVRSNIEARKQNPPAAATGDPRATPESTLETYAPFLAHPIDTGIGLATTVAGGVNALAHPLDAIASDWHERGAAAHRMLQRGMMTDDPEQLRDAVSVVLPFIGPAFAAAGRQMNSANPEERARGTGSAIALTSGPEITKTFAGDVGSMLPTEESAIARYQRVIDPKNQNPTVARPIAERLVREGRTMSDPKAELTAIQEARAKLADANIGQAIGNMRQPVDLGNVNASIDAARAAQSKPYGPDSAATIKSLDKYQNDVLPMNAVGDIATKRDVLRPSDARELRQQFDQKPYGSESTTADANARRAVGDALRQEINTDPDVRDANEEFQTEKAGKNLAESIPEPKLYKGNVGSLVLKGGATAAASALGGPIAGKVVGSLLGASEVAKYVKSIVQSPEYQTWSAIKKSQFANAVAAKDLARIGEIAGTASPFGIQSKDDQ